MKKRLLLIGLIGLNTFAFSQITVANNNNVGIGTDKEYVPEANLQIGDSENTGSPEVETEIKRLSLAPVVHTDADWFFTTRDNKPYANLDVGYGDDKALTIRHDGNIGIGVSNPMYEFTISNGSNSSKMAFMNSSYPEQAVIEYNGNTKQLRFQKWEEGNWASTIMSIDTNSNRIGIGTVNPQYALDVNGRLRVQGSSLIVDGFDFVLGRNDGRDIGVKTSQRALAHGGNDELLINYGGDFEGGVLMFGNVGIGVHPDTENRLTIKGKVKATSYLATAASSKYADYVFEKYYEGVSNIKEDYKMPSLEEVEVFVKENKHLPEVPSYKEVQEQGGVDLGNMSNILLQKIEELTLYTIEQNKLNKAQAEQLREQQLLLNRQQRLLDKQGVEIKELQLKK